MTVDLSLCFAERDEARAELALRNQELAKANAERDEATAALAIKVQQLAEANERLEQFAYVASHDLREPLRMISAYIALLDRRYADRLDDDGREFLEIVRDGAQRLDRMVLDLLEYARIGRTSEIFEPVSMAEAIDTAITNLQPKIDLTSAEIRVGAHLPMVIGCRSDLTRLAQNLIDNALKYRRSDRTPVIVIDATHGKDAWTMSVSDNGIGIAPEYFDRIFAIFQRLHPRDKYEGSGIGLAICRRIVENHGGRIWVESEPGKGSTFLFTLPDTTAATRPAR